MKTIPLNNSNNVVAVVDDEDYDRLKVYGWLLSSKGYIVRYYGSSSDRHQVRMHNEVLNMKANSGVDHINNMKWDNTKENLRIVSHSVNSQNKGLLSTNSVGFKGVTFDKGRKSQKKYKATLCVDGKNKTIGYFETPEEAAKAYDKLALEIYGVDAMTNEKIRNGGY